MECSSMENFKTLHCLVVRKKGGETRGGCGRISGVQYKKGTDRKKKIECRGKRGGFDLVKLNVGETGLSAGRRETLGEGDRKSGI